jgi:hypothetical protein
VTPREQLLADYEHFLEHAPVRAVEGIEEEPRPARAEDVIRGVAPGSRQLARLSCGHLQSVWRAAGIRCLGCYLEAG